MAFAFKLPDVGEGITEGEIIRWLVQAGDTVRVDQPLVEVQTDKAVVELPSPRAGRILECRGAPGDVIPVGATLVVIADDASPVAPVREPAPAPVPDSPRPPAAGGERAKVQAAPATRRLAKDLGVDLAQVAGTGPRGRVVPADVRRAVEAMKPPPSVAPARAEARTEVPLTGLRRVIAQHMSQTWREIPHVTVVEKARADELVAVRERLKAVAEARGERLTYLPLVAKALSMALKDHPAFNARWEDGRLYRYADVHVGLAMDTEDGLVVPVIRDVGQKSLWELARETAERARDARDRRLTPPQLSGSTITITGGGPLEGLFATPLINYPEVAIVGVYRIRQEAWVVDGRVEAAPSLYLSLTFDHRIADGAEASRFLRRLIDLLEAPASWLLDLR